MWLSRNREGRRAADSRIQERKEQSEGVAEGFEEKVLLSCHSLPKARASLDTALTLRA